MSAASADLTSLARDLAAAGMGSYRAAAQVVQQTASQVAAEAKSLAPVKTGKLRASIVVRYVNPLHAEVGPAVPYGVYQEFGTASRGEFGGAPYVIRPRKPGGRLVFKVDGKTVAAKQVRHPGVPPHPYMRPALVSALGSMAPRLAESGALLITRGPNA